MKTPLLLLAALAVAGFASADETPSVPEFPRASVTIPYTELRALWEAGQAAKARPEKPPAAPVGSVIQQAELELQLGDRASVLVAKYGVEVLHAQWQTIPLLGGEVRLEQADAAGRQVVWQEGYTLLTDQPGAAGRVAQSR